MSAKAKSRRDADALAPRQQRFVAEYLIDLNATQAAIRAGYSAKTAEVQGPRLLGNVRIQAAVQSAMSRREKRTEITQDRVLQELAKIGFADIRKAVRWSNQQREVQSEEGVPTLESEVLLVPSAEMDDATAAAISEVSQGQHGLRIKMHDKRAALVDMGRHLGMFVEKSEVTVKDGGVLRAPPEVSAQKWEEQAASQQAAKPGQG